MGQRRALCRELGAELQKRREAAGLTNAELAERVGWSKTRISRMETGQNLPTTIEVIQYLGRCGIFYPQGEDMLELCREASRARRFWLNPQDTWLEDSLSALIYHETTATSSTAYEPLLVPGLLQTADYARAAIASERWWTADDVDHYVRVRLERKRILLPPHRGRFMFFLHEQVLRAQVGSAALMHEQLLHIVLLTALDQATVRVVPASAAGQLAFGGPFRLFEFPECQPLVYLDNHATGLFLEDRDFVAPYRVLVSALSDVALDGGQSREWIATMAMDYERGSEQDADHRLEEEQL